MILTQLHQIRVFTFAATIALAALSPALVVARPVEVWSESDLHDKADLIVIAKAKSTKDVPAERTAPLKKDAKIEVITEFEVQTVLKGKLTGKTVGVRHQRYLSKQAEIEVVDGPSLVEFNVKKPQQYLIFLKGTKVDDEIQYEPLTGQHDPDGSFFLMQRYHASRERE